MVDRPGPAPRNRQGSSHPHQGLVVVKRGKGACIWCPSLGMCLLPKSAHAVGQWLSFDIFTRGVAPKHNSDIENLVDINRHRQIPAPVPTFVTFFSKKTETPVLYISSMEEAEHFLAEQGQKSLPQLYGFPVFVYRILQSAGGQLSFWEVVQNPGGISAVQSKEYSICPQEYIERVLRQRELQQQPPQQLRPRSPSPIPQRPNPDVEATEAVFRLLAQSRFQDAFAKYDGVAYRKLCRLADDVHSTWRI